MTNSDKLAAAVEDSCRQDRWERTMAQRDGAVMLEALLQMLDNANEFRRRHDETLFDMSPNDEERAVLVRYRGILVAKWLRDGRTLKLHSPPDEEPPVAKVATAESAFVRTISFVSEVLPLLGRDWPPKPARRPRPKLGFLS